MESVIFLASLVVKKIVCWTLSEKRTSEAISTGCWLEEFSCDSV